MVRCGRLLPMATTVHRSICMGWLYSMGVSRLNLPSLLRVRGSKGINAMGYVDTNRGYVVLEHLSEHWEMNLRQLMLFLKGSAQVQSDVTLCPLAWVWDLLGSWSKCLGTWEKELIRDRKVTTSYILQRNVEAMSQRVGEAKGVLQMSNRNAISKTRRLPKGWKHGMSNATMKLG